VKSIDGNNKGKNEMDWKQTVRNVAPTIGTALGGPLAGTAVKLLADKFLGKQDATEAEVAAAIQGATSEQLIKLKEIDTEFKKFVMQISIEEKKIEAGLLTKQVEMNVAEAGHKSVFISGWRPAAGWICVGGLAYKFLGFSLLNWIWTILQAIEIIPLTISAPPNLETAELIPILIGMLGLGGYRTIEGLKGVKTQSLN
jgi:hypothetical protein